MAYTQIDTSKPDPTTQNITDFSTSVRNNIRTLRDNLIAGTLVKWSAVVTVGTGTAEQPQYITHSNMLVTNEKIRETITWGATGGATGNPDTILYEYTSTGTFDTTGSNGPMGTIDYTYDTDGNVTSWTWS